MSGLQELTDEANAAAGVAAAQENEQNNEEDSGPTVEEQAAVLGWKDPKEFGGNPEKAKTAEEFIEWSNENHSLTRADNKKMQATIHRQGEELKQVRSDVELQKQTNDIALKAQRNMLQKEYDAKIETAVKDGDIDEFKKLETEKQEALKEPDNKEPDIAPVVDKFKSDNDWYGKDRAMTVFADSESSAIRAEYPDLSIEDNLAKVSESVKAEFSHKFENQKRNGASEVGSGKRVLHKKASKTFDGMPQEFKDGCARAIKIGLVADKDTYVKNYWAAKE